MRRYYWSILLGIAAVVIFTIPVYAQTAAPTSTASSSPLLNLLAVIPDNADTRPANGLGVSYADYRALESSQNLPRPTSTWDYTTKNLYFHNMLRIRAGIPLDNYLSYIENSAKVVGFDWSMVDQSIEIGSPPRTGLILAGTFDKAAIGKALKARNFEQITIDGITVWRRFDDAQLQIDAREPADPFGGNLGEAARIALLPGLIANSRYTAITTQFIEAFNHKQNSLAEADDYRVLTDAIRDPATYNGQLIQAVFVAPAAFAKSAAPQGSKIDPSTYGKLPSYTLGVLADRQEGTSQVNLIALYYPDVQTAQQASIELGKRIAGFDINERYERLNVVVDTPRVYQESNGKAAAVISVHYDLPSATPDPNGGPVPAPGLIYSYWIQAIYARQFTPLDSGQ